MDKQIADANKHNQELNEKKENANSKEYIEEVAREKLGLVHEGEILFVPEEKK